VRGSPYEMGLAYGQLMGDAIKYDVKEMFNYIEG
jgi:hypothetical protein